MKKILVFLLFLLFLYSYEKEYLYKVYAETRLFSSLAYKETDKALIKASNAATALEKLHQKFLKSMRLKFDRNKDFNPKICYFKLFNSEDRRDILFGSFIQNPKETVVLNVSICLSKEFREYVKI